jgi:hypothetical protein
MAFRWANIPKAIRSLIGRNDPGGGVWVPGYTTESGISVSAEQAMRLAAVHSCVRVLSEDVGALPLNVYEKKKGGGRERADKHPLFDLVHNRPNPEMVSQSFIEAQMVNLLLEGNAYSFIEYDRAGRILGIWPLLSYGVRPFRDMQTNKLKYSIGGKDYSPSEILHIPGANSIPIEELEKHLSSLPKNQEIVAYCRGRYCLLSVEAVVLLRKHGLKAVRLEESAQEWFSQNR